MFRGVDIDMAEDDESVSIISSSDMDDDEIFFEVMA